MNYSAKFDAASFFLGGEILNRTNTQTTKRTNIIRHIDTLTYQHVWI